MKTSMSTILRRLRPIAPPVSSREKVRSALGALLGICATGLIASWAVGADAVLPALIAPMGASAVLLFAVPSSPLAQPWSILCGNTVAAVIGVTAALFITDPVAAAAVAIGAAMAAMSAMRCLHPPSGAIALTAVLGGPAIHHLGYGFVLWPVAGNSLLLVIMALIYNNMSGHAYPHAAKPAAPAHQTIDPPQVERIGFTSADLDEVLREHDEFIDIDRDDLETILRRTELRSFQRRGNHTACSSIMSRDVVVVTPQTSLREAQDLMRTHHFRALPVINRQHEVIGIVTQTDLLHKTLWVNGTLQMSRFQRWGLAVAGAGTPARTVKDIMTTPVRTIHPDTPLTDAIILFAETGLHHLPVVGNDNRLAGILSQSDVMVAMLAEKAA
jgi:CBS domain-containing membrane protein